MQINKKIENFKRINILNVRVDDVSLDVASYLAVDIAKRHGRGRYFVTVNPEFVMMAYRNKNFARILSKSDVATADGVGVAISKLMLGGTEHDRVTGVDLINNICKIASEKAVTVGFLGGFGSVAGEVAKRQTHLYPNLKVKFAKPGEPTISYDLRLKRDLDSVGRIDILFVAYGMGKQEFWIDRMREKLDIGLYIGVGGAFDYLARRKRRAPQFLQNIGLEWLWRLMLDPVRIWRMRVLPIFAILVFLQIFRKKLIGKIF